jgi:hypothetical protein
MGGYILDMMCPEVHTQADSSCHGPSLGSLLPSPQLHPCPSQRRLCCLNHKRVSPGVFLSRQVVTQLSWLWMETHPLPCAWQAQLCATLLSQDQGPVCQGCPSLPSTARLKMRDTQAQQVRSRWSTLRPQRGSPSCTPGFGTNHLDSDPNSNLSG